MVYIDHQIQFLLVMTLNLLTTLHQQICTHFKVDYLEEMDIIKQTKRRIEQKINVTLPALLANKIIQTLESLALEKREQYQ